MRMEAVPLTWTGEVSGGWKVAHQVEPVNGYKSAVQEKERHQKAHFLNAGDIF